MGSRGRTSVCCEVERRVPVAVALVQVGAVAVAGEKVLESGDVALDRELVDP